MVRVGTLRWQHPGTSERVLAGLVHDVLRCRLEAMASITITITKFNVLPLIPESIYVSSCKSQQQSVAGKYNK